jgi:flagellum-specific peptidoglycan hydrolase FlgJ
LAGSKSFFKEMQGYAMTASAVLGMPYQVILAQWALESTYGTSDLAVRAKNFAGIKSSSQGKDFVSGSYAGYNTIPRFVQDYIRVMQLPYYNEVRQVGGIEATINALDRSPWAEDSGYGAKLRQMLSINDVSTDGATNTMSVLGVFGNILSSPFLWVGALVILMFKR